MTDEDGGVVDDPRGSAAVSAADPTDATARYRWARLRVAPAR